MREAGCQFCEFFKLGIFKNWAFCIENQNKLLHFPEIGLQLYFILSKIVLDFMMNRIWVLNFTFWMRLKANWILGLSDLWNLLLVVWVAVGENWKYCVPAPYQLVYLFLCPPIPVNKLESNKKIGTELEEPQMLGKEETDRLHRLGLIGKVKGHCVCENSSGTILKRFAKPQSDDGALGNLWDQISQKYLA